MAVQAVWIMITIPTKEYEKELNDLKKKNINNLDNSGKFDSNNFTYNNDYEKIVDDCMKDLQVSDVVWMQSKNGKYHQIYFSADTYDNDATLQYLHAKGIGVDKHTSVGYIPFGLFYCNDDEDFNYNNGNSKGGSKSVSAFKKIQTDFLNSVTSRLTVMQVVEGVRNSATVNCDFVLYTFFAGCITSAGLMNNDPIDIASAMLIEPVMSTVLAMSFGAVIHDRRLFAFGLRNCAISLLLCLLIGFGYCGIAMIWYEAWNPPGENGGATGVWPTDEMQGRGLWRVLWYGALQAAAAGGAVSVSLLNNNMAALVGVAVCSTFLPPFLNGGALFVWCCHLQARGAWQDWITVNDTQSGETFVTKPAWVPLPGYTYVYNFDMRLESASLGGVSLLYTIINVVFLGLAAYLVLKLKEIVPLGQMESNRKFFKEDIKVARYYNRQSNAPMNEKELGNQILTEWAKIAGLDPKRLMGENAEAAVTRLQTLRDLIGDVHNNDNFQTVTRRAFGRPYQRDILRRMTQANIHERPETNPAFSYDDDVERYGGQRKFSAYPVARRRGTRWIVDEGSQYSTVNSGSGSMVELTARGLRPRELSEEESGRRNSELLEQTLRETQHLPYSIWPSNDRRPPHRMIVDDLKYRLSPNSERLATNAHDSSIKNNSESTKF